MTRLRLLACLLLLSAAPAAAQRNDPGAAPPTDPCAAFLPAPTGGRDRFKGAAPDDVRARAARLAASFVDRGDLDGLLPCLAGQLDRAE